MNVIGKRVGVTLPPDIKKIPRAISARNLSLGTTPPATTKAPTVARPTRKEIEARAQLLSQHHPGILLGVIKEFEAYIDHGRDVEGLTAYYPGYTMEDFKDLLSFISFLS